MVDTRLRGEWLGAPRFDNLSDVAWRLLTHALMWCNNQSTDGLIDDRNLRRIHPDGPQPQAVDELVLSGFLIPADGGYQVPGWEEEMGQSTAEYVDKKRSEARERMRKLRGSNSPKSEVVPRNVRANVPRYVGQAQEEALGASKEEKERAFFDGPEPSPFCVQHTPAGPAGESCRGCMDQRKVIELWKSRQKPKRVLSDAELISRSNRRSSYAHVHAPIYESFREDDGHAHNFDEWGHCRHCGATQPMEANA